MRLKFWSHEYTILVIGSISPRPQAPNPKPCGWGFGCRASTFGSTASEFEISAGVSFPHDTVEIAPKLPKPKTLSPKPSEP